MLFCIQVPTSRFKGVLSTGRSVDWLESPKKKNLRAHASCQFWSTSDHMCRSTPETVLITAAFF